MCGLWLPSCVGQWVFASREAAKHDLWSCPRSRDQHKLKGKLISIKYGDANAEAEAVIQVGSIKIIVTKKRKPYHYLSDFTDLKLYPSRTDILIVKIGYLVPELYEIRGNWIMALTPGGVDQDLYRLDYKNIKRPMFPLDKDMSRPDLSSKLIPVIN